MKQKIHPKYYDDCKATCVCGNSFITGSTLPEIKVEICAACHPFFTGEMKYVDTLGRVDKFKKKQDKISGKKYVKKSDRKKFRDQKEKKESEKKPKSLKEMIQKEMKKNKKA